MSITRKIRLLLDKATATEFPAEAEAFFAKATELMAEHDVTDAAIRAAGGAQATEITQKTFEFVAPYAKGKMMIGWNLHEAFGLEGILIRDTKSTKQLLMMGTAEKLAAFETMLASVSLHSTGALLQAEASKPEWEHARTFKASFLDGYSARIGSVVKEGMRAGRAAGTSSLTEDEAKGAALVLLDDSKRVKQAFEAAFPRKRTTKRAYVGGSGYGRGATAASQFNGARTGVSGSRGALGQ